MEGRDGNWLKSQVLAMALAILAYTGTTNAAAGQAMGKAEVDSTGTTAAPAGSPPEMIQNVPAVAIPKKANVVSENTNVRGPRISSATETPTVGEAGQHSSEPSRNGSILGGGGLSMPALPAFSPMNGSDLQMGGVSLTTPAAEVPSPPHPTAASGEQAIAPKTGEPLSTGGVSPTPAFGPLAPPQAGATSKPAEVDPIERKAIGGAKTGATASDTSAASNAGGSGTSIPAGLMSILQVGGALTLVIGLIFIGKGMAKKFVPGARTGGGKGVIEVLARQPIAKNQALVLVRIGSQIVALSQSKERSESVLVISDSAEVARIIGQIEGSNPKSIQAGFNKALANARMDLEQGNEEVEDEGIDGEPDIRSMNAENLDEQLDEMAAAKRQLMELRQHVRSVRDALPRA